MLSRDDAFARHQPERWLRPDAARWVRGDISRYLRPDSDVAKAVPAIGRKYNADQPRVPAGNPDGGQWTDGSSSASDAAQPTGGIDFGDLPNFSDLFAIFQIAPQEFDNSDDVQLAGDPPGIGHNNGPPLEPPEIPVAKPSTSSERVDFLKDAASWLGQLGKASLPAQIFIGAMNNVEWLNSYQGIAQSYNDPPKSLEELQSDIAYPEKGYQIHHIIEQTAAERWGLSRSEIDDPSNLVRIPTMKHWELTGWYGRPNEEFGDLSPRDYLSDKDTTERYRVGLYALRLHGVLKP